MAIMHIMHIIAIITIISDHDCFLVGWLESVGSSVVYELTTRSLSFTSFHSEYPGQAALRARR
jgi:hypothetical protein